VAFLPLPNAQKSEVRAIKNYPPFLGKAKVKEFGNSKNFLREFFLVFSEL
jgi:hypothetical protein